MLTGQVAQRGKSPPTGDMVGAVEDHGNRPFRPHGIVGPRMSPTVPFRDTFWNVPGWAQVLLYVGGAGAMALFAWGMWQRVRLRRAGLPENRLGDIPRGVTLVGTHAPGQ